uniref:Uncharacterized protein n=1 Tax=Oryza brachyantha TaxID=4533 RepID=J3MSM3_ORYBR
LVHLACRASADHVVLVVEAAQDVLLVELCLVERRDHPPRLVAGGVVLCAVTTVAHALAEEPRDAQQQEDAGDGEEGGRDLPTSPRRPARALRAVAHEPPEHSPGLPRKLSLYISPVNRGGRA